jgi:hypothetical protein
MSAVLHLPNEVRIPVRQNHSEIAKFISHVDKTYLSVVAEVERILNDIGMSSSIEQLYHFISITIETVDRSAARRELYTFCISLMTF